MAGSGQRLQPIGVPTAQSAGLGREDTPRESQCDCEGKSPQISDSVDASHGLQIPRVEAEGEELKARLKQPCG